MNFHDLRENHGLWSKLIGLPGFLLLFLLGFVYLAGDVVWSYGSTDCQVEMVKIVSMNNGHHDDVDTLVPTWTRSYQQYKQPHAVWLSRYEFVGVNLPVLKKVLLAATQQNRVPEVVVYSVPDRDMGQSSAGGFGSYDDYFADNRLQAAEIKRFTEHSKLKPRVYLEPDALAHAITYRKERGDDAVSMSLYKKRTQAMNVLVKLYEDAGARVYLDAAHSGWFDYQDSDIKGMADALNASGIVQADGLVTNVSNRQPLWSNAPLQTETHYLKRLLPKLSNRHLDVVVDTSRNGRALLYFTAREYRLSPDGILRDNEAGYEHPRQVGRWERNEYGELWVHPFYGKPMMVDVLTRLDKYRFNSAAMRLIAPRWLDPVGDVQVGKPPTDFIGKKHTPICRYRHIKPPDDCDGSLNCPAGFSKTDILLKTKQRQKQSVIEK